MDKKRKTKIYENFIKRLLDIILSFFAIIIFSPILIIVAILVRIKLGSPVIFTQNRPGKNVKIFKLYKFRTMKDLKDENGELLPDSERLTAFGKRLRATSLDELPELFNILKGDMAIVGPRPLLEEYVPYYTEKEMKRHDVRPGLSGLAQINGRNASSWEETLGYDIDYVNNISFTRDLSIVFQTIGKVVKKSDIIQGSDNKIGRFDDYRKSM